MLNSDFYLRLAARPAELEQIALQSKKAIVVIDEVQKIPALLDEVHRLIEEQGIKFLLTGSSSRKLVRGGANLLAGRAWTARLVPLTSHEIQHFDLVRYLHYGGLPAVHLSSLPIEELQAYVQTYLTEEIAAEGWVRDLPRFSIRAFSEEHKVKYKCVVSQNPVNRTEGGIEFLHYPTFLERLWAGSFFE